MRTNIVIDDDLLLKQQEIRDLRGKLRWTGDLDRMRRDRSFQSIPADGRTSGIGCGESVTSGDCSPRQP